MRTVVVDSSGPLSHDNLCFDPILAKEPWYRFSGVTFQEVCLKRGIRLITPDVYFKERPKNAICMRDSVNGRNYTKELREAGVRLAALVALEQPLYAPRFYWNLTKESEAFDYTFTYSGLKTWVSPKSKFVNFLGYNAYPQDMAITGSFERKFLTLINSNHRLHVLKKLYAGVRNFVKPMPTLLNKEGYVERLEAIRYFSQSPDFDLYGHFWDKPVRYTRGRYDEFIKRAYRGTVDDKLETLKKYKFSICFENCSLGGFITEKIIDSMFAGCVPVYWGAPDVTDFIPANCFIDYRNFKDFAELHEFLLAMNEETYNSYIQNINKFREGAYHAMSAEHYMNCLIKIFEAVK